MGQAARVVMPWTMNPDYAVVDGPQRSVGAASARAANLRLGQRLCARAASVGTLA